VKHWFERLPIHRKLVTSALLITAVGLVVAMAGLSAFDVWRSRRTASDDAQALARVLAENTAAAVLFNQPDAAAELLRSVRVREVVTRACIYLPDGALFSGFARAGACPSTAPSVDGWVGIVGTAPITRNDRTYGAVYIERNTSDLRGRVLVTLLAGLIMFAIAASAAYLLAQRVNAGISRPIADLARFARSFGTSADPVSLTIKTAPDEMGELVGSFNDMVTRVRTASDELRQSNEALLREQAEREAALRRERDANRLKDEFLAAVSHELRTPLNAMMGWAQILATTKPTEDTIRKAVASIVKNAQAQTRVIEDLIDVSRIVTGKLRLTFTHVDMRAVIASAIEALEPVAAAKGVSLEQRVPRTPCVMAGDRDRLQQVIWNLLSNAIKFTPTHGSVTLDLSCIGESINLRVTDTGIGISAPFLPHVFERFRQADGSMTRAHGGLGLGLAIVKELTELHGGSVSAASPGEDQGTTFSLTFPMLVADAGGEEPEVAVEDPPPSLNGLSVMVIDDNEDAVAILSNALRRAGASVKAFTDAEAALAEWEHKAADILVCDLAMPGMSGFDVLAHVRSVDSARGMFTPAVAVSAYASERHKADSIRAGFQEHIAKPVDHAALVRAVARVVAQS
jgi:signal transduction histidine kinase/ActR/RegA family two-component response regulator